MSNFPDDFKGTNMDAPETIGTIEADVMLAAMQRLKQHDIPHIIKTLRLAGVSKDKLSEFAGMFEDMIDDLIADPWAKASAISGNPAYPAKLPPSFVAWKCGDSVQFREE